MSNKRRQHYLEDHHLLDFSISRAFMRAFKEELEPVKEDTNAEMRSSIKEHPMERQNPQINLLALNSKPLSELKRPIDFKSGTIFLDRNESNISPSKSSSYHPLNKTLTDAKELKIKSKELMRITNTYCINRPKLQEVMTKQVGSIDR